MELAKEGGTWTGQVGRASLLSTSLASSQTASSVRPEPLAGRHSRCLQTRTGAQPDPRVPVRPPS